MESMLKMAQDFLQENPGINEVELTDGPLTVRVARMAPVAASYYANYPTYYPWPGTIQYPVVFHP